MGGFRPFTEYMCTIVATNSQGSGPPAISTTTTNKDGECMNDSCIAILLLFLLVDSVIPRTPLKARKAHAVSLLCAG